MAEALYRKYRPQIFEDVVGQEHIERTLKNAIEQDKVSHAYLFTGPRGTGKTTTARLLAKALLCECGPTPTPDGTCEDCVMIANGEHPDVYELDAASRTGVENVREEIIGRVQYAPTRGRYKIYIIDEVHMLSTAAFNALLKTLEEPPAHVVFILATTDPQKVPETIHSRCQRFDFHRISPEAIVGRLAAICTLEGIDPEPDALDLIAHRADGGMRNALTSLEQLIAFGEGEVKTSVALGLFGGAEATEVGELLGLIGRRDVAGCFSWIADYVESGADLAVFARELAERVRNLYVMTLAGADVALDITVSERSALEKDMQFFGEDRLARMMGVLGDLSAELKTSTNARLSFEIALTRMVRPDADLTLASLAERIEALESGYSSVAHVISVPASAESKVEPMSVPVVPSGASAAASAPAPLSAPAPTQVPMPAPAAAPAPTPAPASIPAQTPVPVQAPPAAQQSAPSAPAAQSATPTAGMLSPTLIASLQNPATVQRVWHEAQSILKRDSVVSPAMFLTVTTSFDAAAQVLVIEFPANTSSFVLNMAQRTETSDAVAAALHKACGEPLAFEYRTAGQSTGVQPQSQPQPQPQQRAAAQPIPNAPLPPQAPAPIPASPIPAPAPTRVGAPQQPSAAGMQTSAPKMQPAPAPMPQVTPAPQPAPQAPASAPVPVPQAAPAPTTAPQGEVLGSAASQAASAPSPNEASADDLQAILAAGFGDNITFEEI